MYNSTNFDKLRPNQELFLVRYSHAPTPDYVRVIFKSFNKQTNNVEIVYKNDNKKKLKRFPIRKAKYRIFKEKLEMVKSLVDCHIKREVDLTSEYEVLVEQSKDERPEIWI